MYYDNPGGRPQSAQKKWPQGAARASAAGTSSKQMAHVFFLRPAAGSATAPREI